VDPFDFMAAIGELVSGRTSRPGMNEGAGRRATARTRMHDGIGRRTMRYELRPGWRRAALMLLRRRSPALVMVFVVVLGERYIRQDEGKRGGGGKHAQHG
jgi:hypothetical protein